MKLRISSVRALLAVLLISALVLWSFLLFPSFYTALIFKYVDWISKEAGMSREDCSPSNWTDEKLRGSWRHRMADGGLGVLLLMHEQRFQFHEERDRKRLKTFAGRWELVEDEIRYSLEGVDPIGTPGPRSGHMDRDRILALGASYLLTQNTQGGLVRWEKCPWIPERFLGNNLPVFHKLDPVQAREKGEKLALEDFRQGYRVLLSCGTGGQHWFFEKYLKEQYGIPTVSVADCDATPGDRAGAKAYNEVMKAKLADYFQGQDIFAEALKYEVRATAQGSTIKP